MTPDQSSRSFKVLEAEATAIVLQGRQLEIQGQYGEAREHYLRTLELDRIMGNRFDEGVTIALLGQVAWAMGDLKEANRLLLQALRIHHEAHDNINVPATLTTLGQVAQEQGRFWLARWYFVRSSLFRITSRLNTQSKL